MKSKFILLLLSSLGQKKPKRETSDRGFTLIEVIVAIVILSIFILTSLSAVVAGLNLKLKAKLNNEATLLIQQDLEKVRYVASTANNLTVDSTLPTASVASSVTLPIVLTDGKNMLSNSSVNASLKVGTETKGYTLAIKPASTDASVAVKVDVTKTLKTTKLDINALGTLATIIVADAAIFANGQNVLIGSSSVVVRTVLSVNTTTRTVVFSTNLGNNYAQGTPVTILPSSGETIADLSVCPSATNGYVNTIATRLITFLVTAPQTKTVSQVSLNNSNYAISRTPTKSPSSDFRVELDYKVAEPTALTACETTNPDICLAILKTEVVPSVALQCP